LPKTITATAAARHFRAVLNEIEDSGETFRIERHGRMVAELRPVNAAGQRFTGRDLADLLQRLPPLDPDFGSDLARVRAAWPVAPRRDPWEQWESSSIAQS
jgi:antitoxin (DNA-binding transcriptional repressor) of toxin-antitoxin stability system